MPGCRPSPARHHVPGPGRLGDLHRHLHHHPGRRGRRAHHQHRHRHRAPRPAGPTSPPRSHGDHPSQRPAITHRQVGQRHQLRRPRAPRHLQLPGDQHRQRDPEPGRRHRPHAGLSAITCPGTTGPWLPAGTGDLHRHLHHHPGRRRRRRITNTGTATGTPPTGSNGDRHVDGHHPASRPGIDLVKSASVVELLGRRHG